MVLSSRVVVRAGKFFWYFLFLFLTLLYYSFYGILTVVISPSVQASIFLTCFAMGNLPQCLRTVPQLPLSLMDVLRSASDPCLSVTGGLAHPQLSPAAESRL